MKKITLICAFIFLAGAFVWYLAQYIRTGHFLAYINPPSFQNVPSKRIHFIDKFYSYSSPAQIESHLLDTGHKMNLKNSKIESLEDKTFRIDEFIVSDIELDKVIWNLEMDFYNNRLEL